MCIKQTYVTCISSVKTSPVMSCDELAHTSCWMFVFLAPCGRKKKKNKQSRIYYQLFETTSNWIPLDLTAVVRVGTSESQFKRGRHPKESALHDWNTASTAEAGRRHDNKYFMEMDVSRCTMCGRSIVSVFYVTYKLFCVTAVNVPAYSISQLLFPGQLYVVWKLLCMTRMIK